MHCPEVWTTPIEKKLTTPPPKNSLKSKPVHYTGVSGSYHLKRNSHINSATLNWNFSLKYYIWQTQQIKQARASELLGDFKSKHTLFNKDILSSLLPGCSPTKIFKHFAKDFSHIFPGGCWQAGSGQWKCKMPCLSDVAVFGWMLALFSRHTKRVITPMTTFGYRDLSKLCFSVLSLPLNKQYHVSST